jgi:hypothetical protein
MQLINAVDAKLGDKIAMINTVFTGVSEIVMGELVSRTFEDIDGWITLTIKTPTGNVSRDFPFDAFVVKESDQ